MSLTLEEIRLASISRSKKWHEKEQPWDLRDWIIATVGELGELCNVQKKKRRIETGAPNINTEPGRQISDQYEARLKMLYEAADTFLYLQIVAESAREGYEYQLPTFEEAIKHVFNTKSVEYGFPERL